MVKKRRIFIGYQLSKALQYEIGRWREKFFDLPVRWTPLEFLHVTLVPPWYEKDVDKIARLLRSMPQQIRQFSVTFETINLGPDSNRPRLIWARGEMPPELFSLRVQLSATLQRFDDRRSSMLHTTLARFTNEQFGQFSYKQFLEIVKWEEKITSFSLIESHLRRTGAVYETLAKIQI